MRRRRSALTLAVFVLSLGGAAVAWALTGADRLEGMVVDDAGTPAGGTIVSLSGRGVRREALTNNGGGFQIEPVTPGVYLVSAAAGAIASEEMRVEIREGEAPPHITLTLKPPLPVETVGPTTPRRDGVSSLRTLDVFASMPIAGRIEVLLAGEKPPE